MARARIHRRSFSRRLIGSGALLSATLDNEWPVAPHNPQGPCSLAASIQVAASIPNFLIQERGTDTHENLLKVPFKQEKGYLPLPTGPGLGIDEKKLDGADRRSPGIPAHLRPG
jgi:L-alanine-DL-glutamate epimerase-like enolase superfamily enzyme